MKISKLSIVMTIWVGILWLCTPVWAETQHSLQVEATSYIISSQWLPAGDEAGHAIGMAKREGEGVFSNGETAKYATVSTFDSRRTTGGIAQGYSTFTFVDGSQIIFSWKSEIGRTQDGLPYNQGHGTILKGTGRFEGIRGISDFSGQQLKPAADDPKLTTGQKATITYILP
ncbi:hypothetical protein [Pelosinus sp. sgz500959]|uniref:hypothetical protein n=1 Tax=Pelosinus sp. sgz500959 TaxID=3242472 RepID=UPI003672EAD3